MLLGEGRENWKVLSAAFLHDRDELVGLDPVDINVVVSGDQQQSGQQMWSGKADNKHGEIIAKEKEREKGERALVFRDDYCTYFNRA